MAHHACMTGGRNSRGRRHDVVAIPTVWLTFLLSLCIHIAALWLIVPKLEKLMGTSAAETPAGASLAVRLEPRAASAPAQATLTAPPPAPQEPPKLAEAPAPRPQRTRPAVRQPPPRNVITLERPAARAPAPVTSNVEAPPPRVEPPAVAEPKAPAEAPPAAAAKPVEQDLASYIAARKRERGESSQPAEPSATAGAKSPEDDIKRRDAIVARNLGLNETPSFGYDPKRAGGIFQIEHMDSEYADFYYFGFDKDIRRKARQLIEVRRGTEPDIRTAIVHKMIAIIRENVSGDFVWISRSGPVMMSARPGDNAELERFIMDDVFPDARLER